MPRAATLKADNPPFVHGPITDPLKLPYAKKLSEVRTLRLNEAFRILVTCAACALTVGQQESLYLETIKGLDRHDLEIICHAFALLQQDMQERPYRDLLGPVYMEIGHQLDRKYGAAEVGSLFDCDALNVVKLKCASGVGSTLARGAGLAAQGRVYAPVLAISTATAHGVTVSDFICPAGASLIPLTQGKFAIVDEQDFDWLNQWKWAFHSNGYAYRSAGGRKNRHCILMHRLIAGTTDGADTDHINRNKLDNRRANLRTASRAQNMANRGPLSTNTSGFKGVSKTRHGLWSAEIIVAKRKIFLGKYVSAEDAARVVDAAAIEHFKTYAHLNLPERLGEPLPIEAKVARRQNSRRHGGS